MVAIDRMGHVITTPEAGRPAGKTNTVVQRHSTMPTSRIPRAVPRAVPRRSQSILLLDPSSPKGQMALMEKILQAQLEKLTNYRDTRTKRTVIKESIAKLVHILRQRMRILRRWRNGSVDWSDEDLQEFGEFVRGSRIDVFAIEVTCVQDDLDEIDEYILILDDGSNDLRQNVEDDFQAVLRDLERVTLSNGGVQASNKFCDEIDAQLMDINEAVVFLRKKISDQKEPPTPPSGSPICQEDPFDKFETNPARNQVLATADKIRRMLRALQEVGGHVDQGSRASTNACVENDSEVLRRQIRKIRRWQHNAQKFSFEDVDDLRLIISAIERHLSCCPPSPKRAQDGQFTLTSTSSKALSRQCSSECGSGMTGLSASFVSLSLDSNDTTTDLTVDSGVAVDTDPVSDDAFKDGASSTKDGFADISELDEDDDYNERLI